MSQIILIHLILFCRIRVEPMSGSSYEDKPDRVQPVWPFAELNRVQPVVRIASITPGREPDVVRVTVEVAAAEGRSGREGEGRPIRTGVYDVHLFRDGRLVGRWPEPSGDEPAVEPDPASADPMAAWREANRIAVGP